MFGISIADCGLLCKVNLITTINFCILFERKVAEYCFVGSLGWAEDHLDLKQLATKNLNLDNIGMIGIQDPI